LQNLNLEEAADHEDTDQQGEIRPVFEPSLLGGVTGNVVDGGFNIRDFNIGDFLTNEVKDMPSVCEGSVNLTAMIFG
jgi:hypothetical protein